MTSFSENPLLELFISSYLYMKRVIQPVIEEKKIETIITEDTYQFPKIIVGILNEENTENILSKMDKEHYDFVEFRIVDEKELTPEEFKLISKRSDRFHLMSFIEETEEFKHAIRMIQHVHLYRAISKEIIRLDKKIETMKEMEHKGEELSMCIREVDKLRAEVLTVLTNLTVYIN